MSELFETYEREFCDLSGAITCDLNDLQTLGTSRQKTAELTAKFATLQEALRNMELELASLPAAKKAQLSVRLRNFQANAANLKKEFEKAQTAAGRKELLSSANPARYISPTDLEHRDRLQATTDKLSRQNETLKKARGILADTEDIADDTKERLKKQREDMQRTLNTVRETNTEMTRTRKILSLIQRRSLMNKLIMIAVILVLILAVVLVVYFKWIAPLFASSTAPTAPTPSAPSTSVTPPDPSPAGAAPTHRRLMRALSIPIPLP
jgi:vesicle transport through interaction with t-SNAREs protein 1